MSATSTELKCGHCGGPVVVGVGDPPEWMCLEAYQQHLASLRARLDEIRRMAGLDGR